MPLYADLRPGPGLGADWKADEAARRRAIARVIELRDALDRTPGAPPPRDLGTLLLGTWNLREFDSATWGARLPESYLYIAEIVNRFDLVAIQEVRQDLRALQRLRDRLGSHWDWLVSDVTDGKAGNGERLAFLYDTRKVRFLGITGELVLPPVDGKPSEQVARTPLMAAFQVGWTKFVLSTVHIVYGESTAEPAARVQEIEQVARFLRARTDEPDELIRNYIALGDFNIFTAGDKTMKALTEVGGFTIPETIASAEGTNLDRSKKYDQIAYRAPQGRFEATGDGGVFDFFEHVFAGEDADTYRPYIDRYIAARAAAGRRSPRAPETDADAVRQFKAWRTYQMSDHLPLWAEFRIDFADDYLAGLADADEEPRALAELLPD